MWLIEIRRKIKELFALIAGVSVPYTTELTVEGSESTLIEVINSWGVNPSPIDQRSIASVSVTMDRLRSILQCAEASQAIDNSYTSLELINSVNNNGTYSIESITTSYNPMRRNPYTTSITLTSLLPEPTEALGYLNFFDNTTYYPVVSESSVFQYQQSFLIQGSANNDDTYYVEDIIALQSGEYLLVSIPSSITAVDDSAQPGSIYSEPTADDIVVEHNLNAKFVRLSATLNSGSGDIVIIQNSTSYEADANQLTIQKDMWGLEIGNTLKVVVEKLFENLDESEVLAPGGLPDDPIIPKG